MCCITQSQVDSIAYRSLQPLAREQNGGLDIAEPAMNAP